MQEHGPETERPKKCREKGNGVRETQGEENSTDSFGSDQNK